MARKSSSSTPGREVTTLAPSAVTTDTGDVFASELSVAVAATAAVAAAGTGTVKLPEPSGPGEKGLLSAPSAPTLRARERHGSPVALKLKAVLALG
jgi:hypothetical protein